ncbi:preprotein translocase subunit SecE [Lactococcus lactis]|nr:preprotein translocase subunit SecE [Lactococcus lactis]
MNLSTKHISKEQRHIYWLPFPQVLKETLMVMIMSVLFGLLLSGINWTLQQGLNSLLSL